MAKIVDMRKEVHKRIRKKVKGTTSRPRIVVYRSLKHFYMQAIDDTSGVTLAFASSLDKELKDKLKGKNKTNVASEVGKIFSSQLKEKGIDSVVFDRGGFKYHGRVKAAADSLRSENINF